MKGELKWTLFFSDAYLKKKTKIQFSKVDSVLQKLLGKMSMIKNKNNIWY